uniref:Uncharacterized protein n=1 Tax=Caenorhabditis tropicalis TaxID=1561998 RepID=A0A1I7TTC2_9PELO
MCCRAEENCRDDPIMDRFSSMVSDIWTYWTDRSRYFTRCLLLENCRNVANRQHSDTGRKSNNNYFASKGEKNIFHIFIIKM